MTRASIAVAGALALGAACASDNGNGNGNTKVSDMTKPELEIVVDAKHAMAMGYGHAWKAAVREVVSGALADKEISLRTAVNREGTRYGGHFKAVEDQPGVRLTLKRIPARPAALVGFVAADGTIWEIVDVK